MFISNAAETKIGPIAGNIIVWLSLIIGHPIGILMYYHDFVIDHYGQEGIESFGQLSNTFWIISTYYNSALYLRSCILYYHSTIILLKPFHAMYLFYLWISQYTSRHFPHNDRILSTYRMLNFMKNETSFHSMNVWYVL